jgi:hypothetical protein
VAILPAISFPADAWIGLGVAGALATMAIGVFALRRAVLPRTTGVLGTIGAILLCLAAGRPVWRHSGRVPVLVAVDLSASTRSANFRNRGILQNRIAQLVGGSPYKIVYFADGPGRTQADGPMLGDISSEKTDFAPVAGMTAGPILLFSDGQFPLPATAPPTYIAIDSGLEHPNDAAVTQLQIDGSDVAITVSNSASPRLLALRGVTDETPWSAPRGEFRIDRRTAPGVTAVRAELTPGDLWPENDALAAILPPPVRAARWWVGTSPPPGAGWTAMQPAALPADGAAYLSPAVIVLDDVPAAALTSAQETRLDQYVRDLGGSLAILGGPSAFAAGGYPGTALDTLSPLASSPPTPTTHWLLLADSSGSMDADVGGGKTRWQAAVAAMVGVLPHLPEKDLVSAGSFAERLDWWIAGKTVTTARQPPLPPPGVRPHGPTDLDAALRLIAAQASGDTSAQMPRQLLLLTDADAEIDHPADLGESLKRARVHVHLLAIGKGSGLPALRQIATITGGSVVAQFDPAKWADGVSELARSASPAWIETSPAEVHYLINLSGAVDRTVSSWNRTWPKPGAMPIAQTVENGRRTAMAARWNIGAGRAAAVAFAANAMEATAIADLIARPPRDPRFHVTWETEAELRVTIDAVDKASSKGSPYMNGLAPRLELSRPQESAEVLPIGQTGPGLYSLAVPAPRQSALATVRLGGQVLDRVAVAGRYAPEFDNIGNNREMMNTLARSSGGLVIEPSQTRPIDFQWPTAYAPIASELAALGAFCIAMGLVWWRVA